MDEPANARRLVDILANGLEQSPVVGDEARAFISKAAHAMRESTLVRNLQPAAPMRRYAGWESLLALATSQRTDGLVATIANLARDKLPWIEGRHFWPEQEHRHFAERMFGALLMGEPGSAFYTDQRYILMLHIMAPHATYPLHQHRIPEGYYIVAGNPEFTGDGTCWRLQPPGSLYYNKSWAPHGIRTKDQTMLSINIYLPPFGWEGGLAPFGPKASGD